MRNYILCGIFSVLLSGVAFAGDLAETGDLVPSRDITYEQDPLYRDAKRRNKPQARMGENVLRQQQDLAAQRGSQRAVQQTYQQNLNAANAPKTLEIPAGLIPGVGAITVQTGN